jgi:hypothetical protein
MTKLDVPGTSEIIVGNTQRILIKAQCTPASS